MRTTITESRGIVICSLLKIVVLVRQPKTVEIYFSIIRIVRNLPVRPVNILIEWKEDPLVWNYCRTFYFFNFKTSSSIKSNIFSTPGLKHFSALTNSLKSQQIQIFSGSSRSWFTFQFCSSMPVGCKPWCREFCERANSGEARISGRPSEGQNCRGNSLSQKAGRITNPVK